LTIWRGLPFLEGISPKRPPRLSRGKTGRKGSRQAQRERGIVGPGSGRLVMGAVAAHIDYREAAPWPEFHMDAQSITYGNAEKEGGYHYFLFWW
jgi:hypothetical protein